MVVSLSGGTVNFHTWPDLSPKPYLAEVAQVLDFEYYKKTRSARGSKSNQYFIAGLFKSGSAQTVTATLKIFEFVAAGGAGRQFEYVTKIPLQRPQVNPGLDSSLAFPIFDGGISVYQDIFLIQYRDSAEYIKINNMQQKSR